MLGLKRRARVEGWALDVSNTDEDLNGSPMQRLGNNNRLWVVSLVVLLLVAGFLIRLSKRQDSQKNEDLVPPPSSKLVLGNYGDKLHNQFAADFMKNNSSVLSAHFSEGKFSMVVAGDTSIDDIEHMSTMAAQRNIAKFRNRVVVEVYQRRAATGREVLVCTTQWDNGRFGFVPRFIAEK